MSFVAICRSSIAGLACAGVAAGLVTASGVADTARAQSGECGVIGPAANAVCSNPELVALSEELLDAVRELIRTAPVETRPNVMANHRDWSIGLRGCLGGPDSYECIYRSYEERISEVASVIANQVAAPQPPAYPGDPAYPGAPPSFAGQIPVEQGSLPPPPGAAPSQVLANVPPDPTATPGVPGALDGNVASPTAGNGDGAAQTPPADGASPGGTAAEIAAAAGASPGPDAAAPVDPPSSDDGGEIRSAATGSAAITPPVSAGSQGQAEMLTGTVWKAEIASGVRPGTIFVFRDDGSLITADCVESYRIGTWQMGDGQITMHEGNRAEQSAEIKSIQENFVRLEVAGTGGAGRTLVLRPAQAPFSCSSS